MIPNDLRHLHRTSFEAHFAAIAEIVLGVAGGVGLVYGAAQIALYFAR